MKVTYLMVKLKVTASIFIMTKQNTKGNEKMIFKMALGKNFGQMGLNFKGIMNKEKKLEKDTLSEKMGLFIKASFRII